MEIKVLTRHQAETRIPPSNGRIISIYDRSQPPALLPQWSDILRLCFHDIIGVQDYLDSFTPEMALAVISFASKGRGDLYIHCQEGRRRSAAIALHLGDLLQIPVISPTGALWTKATYRGYSREVMGVLVQTDVEGKFSASA